MSYSVESSVRIRVPEFDGGDLFGARISGTVAYYVCFSEVFCNPGEEGEALDLVKFGSDRSVLGDGG